MAISGDYSTPVMVNGYACKNCTDVANAKKQIDPQHPRSGPNGVNAQNDPTVKPSAAVKFDGALAGLNDVVAAKTASAPRTGAQLDVRV